MNIYVSSRVEVGVGVLISHDDKIILIKRTGSHGEGTWSTPGGYIDFGEALEETAIRETKEEVGIDITNVQFKAVTNDIFPSEKKHYITIWMQANYKDGEPTVSSKRELTKVGWFKWTDLPSPLFMPLQNLVDGNHYPSKPLQLQ